MSFFHTFNGMSSDVVAECSEALLARAPVPMSRVFFGASGSDANETQLKLSWVYNNLRGKPEKKKIISRWLSLGRYSSTANIFTRSAALRSMGEEISATAAGSKSRSM
ncbi:hypothetical protein [uncultured Sphingosinicella sp.]|uniref:hypothetical protein n=1 Tax=uncultured Sphingosinicella sp. TaxID=478748 RepID=UPI0030D9B909